MALRGFFVHATTILSNHILEYCAQVHGSKPSEESLEVVLVDEEAVGTAYTVRCGAKVLRGGSGLENIYPFYWINNDNANAWFTWLHNGFLIEVENKLGSLNLFVCSLARAVGDTLYYPHFK